MHATYPSRANLFAIAAPMKSPAPRTMATGFLSQSPTDPLPFHELRSLTAVSLGNAAAGVISGSPYTGFSVLDIDVADIESGCCDSN
jgi:hypothetical protein